MHVEHVLVDDDGVRDAHGDLLDKIEKQGLFYPVTVLDGTPVFDGAVSYPRLRKLVDERLTRLDSMS